MHNETAATRTGDLSSVVLRQSEFHRYSRNQPKTFFSKWLLDVGNDKGGDVNLPVICYPKVQDPITELYNDIYFRDVTSKQLKDREILPVINDISVVLNRCSARR